MITFRHAGDIGDIIYSLPVVRRACEMRGDLAVFLIEAEGYTRQKLTPDRWCGIDLLLRAQPYIQDVAEWKGQKCDFNLNDFRGRMQRELRLSPAAAGKSLADWMLETHRMQPSERDRAWLEVSPYPIDGISVAINRTGPGRHPNHVYHNSMFPWHLVVEKYAGKAVFIGSELEHEAFCKVCGPVQHCHTETLYDAARVIAGVKLFIGNQSACHAIAEGLKKDTLLEVWHRGPNCLFHRPGAIHGWDCNVQLPDA